MHQEAQLKSGLSRLNRLGRIPRLRFGAVVAVALAAAFVVWLVVRNGDNPVAAGSQPAITKTAGIGPVAKSLEGLKTFAAAVGHPVYWAGPKAGKTYELVETSNGRVYVRYLPPGVAVGARRWFLTIATYPYPRAFASLDALARHQGGAIDIGRGGIALVDKAYPKSVHLAWPGVDYQVEVFSPSPALSRRVVVSGQVAAIR